jgi:hypothetical protein
MKHSLSRRTATFLASGDALERWSIKTLLGTYYARIARSEGGAIVDNYEVDLSRLLPPMLSSQLEPPLGLYAGLSVGAVIDNTIGFAPLMVEETNIVGGLQVRLKGLDFYFIVDERAATSSILRDHPFYRPALIDIDGPNRTGRLALTWENHRLRGKRLAISLGRQM